MRFSALLVTLGLTGALATPALVERAAPAIGVISDISEQVVALGSAVSGYSGGDPSAVEAASKKVVSTITSGVETVNGGGAISTTDALTLTPAVQDLTKKVEGVISDIIDKKDKFTAAGAAGTVAQSLQAQYDAADSLAKAISAKVPEALADIAAELSAGITAAIQKGIDAYKGATDGTGSSSSAQPTATGTASATATESDSESATETATETGASSTPVIPTGSSSETESATPTPSASATGSSSGSATSSAPTGLFTGAASKEHFSYTFGGAVVAAAIAVAF